MWRRLVFLCVMLSGCASAPDVVASAESGAAETDRAVAEDSTPALEVDDRSLSERVADEVLLGRVWELAPNESLSDEVQRLVFEGSRVEARLIVDARCGTVHMDLDPIPRLHKFNVGSVDWSGCEGSDVSRWLEAEQLIVSFPGDETMAWFVAQGRPVEIRLVETERSFTFDDDGNPIWQAEPSTADDETERRQFEPLPELSDEVIASEVLLRGLAELVLEDSVDDGYLALFAAGRFVVSDADGEPIVVGEEPYDKLLFAVSAHHGEREPIVYTAYLAGLSHIDPAYGPQTDSCVGGFSLGALVRDEEPSAFTYAPNVVPEIFGDRAFFGEVMCGTTDAFVPEYFFDEFSIESGEGRDLWLTTSDGVQLLLRAIVD